MQTCMTLFYVKLDKVLPFNQQVNKTMSRNPYFLNSEIESDNLTVWNSEIISFDFIEKSLYVIEKYKRNIYLPFYTWSFHCVQSFIKHLCGLC